MFRLAIVKCVAITGCLELQKLVTNEQGEQEWLHFCIVRDGAQALEMVGQLEPESLAQAEADLAGVQVLGSRDEPLPDARRNKRIRGRVVEVEQSPQRLRIR